MITHCLCLKLPTPYSSGVCLQCLKTKQRNSYLKHIWPVLFTLSTATAYYFPSHSENYTFFMRSQNDNSTIRSGFFLSDRLFCKQIRHLTIQNVNSTLNSVFTIRSLTTPFPHHSSSGLVHCADQYLDA